MTDYNINADCNLTLFQRNRFYYGKMMTVGDFETEQGYMNQKRWLLNRLLDGAGIVCGLDGIRIQEEAGALMVMFDNGGVALDSCGVEIVVPPGRKVAVMVEAAGQPLNPLNIGDPGTYYLFLRARETSTLLTRSAAFSAVLSAGSEETCCHSRIIEDFQVIALTDPPPDSAIIVPHTPDIATQDADNSAHIRQLIARWAARRVGEGPPPGTVSGVFILALHIDDDGTVSIDAACTEAHLSLVCNNKMLTQLLVHHISNLDNPHQISAAQLGALETLNGVGRDQDGNIQFIPHDLQNALTIINDHTNHAVRIDETHSRRIDNPHHITAAQVGALQTLNGVQRDLAGNIQLIPHDVLDAIEIIADNANHTVRIAETHSRRTDNPHGITAQELGVLPLTGGGINGFVSITAPETRYLSITGTGAAVSITRCRRLVSITGLMGAATVVSIASPGALTVTSPCSYAVRGLLTGGTAQTQNVLNLLQSNPASQGTLTLLETAGAGDAQLETQVEANTETQMETQMETQIETHTETQSDPSSRGTEETENSQLELRINTNISALTSYSRIDYPNAALQGVSLTPYGHGLYAQAPGGTTALFVNGTSNFTQPAQFRAGMNGYLGNTFYNAAPQVLLSGHVVQLALVSSLGGLQNSWPGVVLAGVAPAARVMGVVASGVVADDLSVANSTIISSTLTLLGAAGDNAETLTQSVNQVQTEALTLSGGFVSSTVYQGENLYVVTHGVFPYCRVDTLSSQNIAVGDWLTFSTANPGLAVKAPPDPAPGTVLGIALSAWNGVLGTGNAIPVFVNVR